MIDFAGELNAVQYDVVSTGDGPCLVLAGAGSGKTRTLVYRVAYLLEHGVKPERILLLTFTNKAAHEMLSRVDELVSRSNKTQPRTGARGATGAGVWGGTFHHVAHRILRKMGTAVGLKQNFTILDREDSKDLLKRILKGVAGSAPTIRLPQPGIFQDVISYARNAGLSIADALSTKTPENMRFEDTFVMVASEYEKKKLLANAVDFDDLLILWLRLLEKPMLREKLGSYWDYILVDEYQDTNVVQDSIVRALAEQHKNLLVVGDDAQSIYSFRAANIQNILQFPQRYPTAKVFKLEENYRSTPEIVEVANQVIEKNQEQFKKKLFTAVETFLKPEVIVARDAADEATNIADRIMALEDEGIPLASIAVLFRAAHQSQALELELNRRAIPYEMRGGLRFFERAHIKDMLAYVRLIANFEDESAWYRTLLLHEGIGEQTAQRIIGDARATGSWNALATATISIKPSASNGWRSFLTTIQAGRTAAVEGVGPMIRSLKKVYATYAQLAFTDFKDRLDDIEQLALFADRYENLDDFVAETSLQEAFVLRPGVETAQENGVVLSTIHQAKGLEWQAVFIMHLTAQSLPHPRAMAEEGGLEEERRLFYVAITRAQRRLYLTYPLSASQYSLTLHQPSQFLMEIQKELLTGELATDDEDQYIEVDENGEQRRSFLPPISRL